MMKRKTIQRECIRRVLEKEQRPLSINEIYVMAKKDALGLGIATVYRAIHSLDEDGFVNRVDLPGQEPRWELLRETHHHHFLCSACDKLYEIDNCPGDIRVLLPTGYTLEDHDILLTGQCRDCNKKKRSKPSS